MEQQTKNDMPWLEGIQADVWIEYSRIPGRHCDLMVAIPLEKPSVPFDLTFSGTDGKPSVTAKFEFLTTWKGSAVYVATEWRPAHSQTQRLAVGVDSQLHDNTQQRAPIEGAA